MYWQYVVLFCGIVMASFSSLLLEYSLRDTKMQLIFICQFHILQLCWIYLIKQSFLWNSWDSLPIRLPILYLSKKRQFYIFFNLDVFIPFSCLVPHARASDTMLNKSNESGGNADWCSHYGKQYGISSKTKDGTAFWSSDPTAEIIP